MLLDKILTLVDSLYIQTTEGLVEWSESVDESSILTSFPNRTILISKSRNSYSISIVDSMGDLSYRADESYWEQQTSTAHEKLARLYNAGFASARGLDNIIDQLISDVSERRKKTS
jgi:hypothetical protein